MSQQQIEVLSEQECFKLVRAQNVGRFVFTDAAGPAAIPVNYGFINDTIVFRVSESSHLREALKGGVAFEVDDLDGDASSPWSVLIRGQAREVSADAVIDIVRAMQPIPQPLAEGVHNVWGWLAPTPAPPRRLGAPLVATVP